MEKYEIINFKNKQLGINFDVLIGDNSAWLSREQIALLYKKDRSVIARHLKKIYEENDLKIDRTCAKNAQVQKEGNRLIKRIVDVYNLDAILKVGILVKSSNGLLLKEWFENYFASKKQELIEYNDGQIQLDVNIDPITETVWLSVNQMALLFETSPDNIYLHIKNIYSEGELFSSVTEESSATQKEIFQTAADGKSYLPYGKLCAFS